MTNCRKCNRKLLLGEVRWCKECATAMAFGAVLPRCNVADCDQPGTHWRQGEWRCGKHEEKV